MKVSEVRYTFDGGAHVTYTAYVVKFVVRFDGKERQETRWKAQVHSGCKAECFDLRFQKPSAASALRLVRRVESGKVPTAERL